VIPHGPEVQNGAAKAHVPEVPPDAVGAEERHGAEVAEERGLPIVRELHRIAKGQEPSARKLEGALEILFGALGEVDAEFSRLLLDGWVHAREDKRFRLTMAWLREQMRLSLAEILAEGAASGAFRPDLDSEAVAAVCLGTAEGSLLQTASHGGPVRTEAILRALMRLVTRD
jgi:hypothetical protein